MNRIAIALLALLIATPAVAQDWARVFAETDAPEAGFQVLVMDPDEPRTDRARYKRVALSDLLPASARIIYLAVARQEYAGLPGATPYLRIQIDDPASGSIPIGGLALFVSVSFESATGDVEVLFGDGPPEPLRNHAGEAVTWADLLEGGDINIAIRLVGTWNLLN